MQPVRLSIAGEYWDSIVYRGRLYLFGVAGDIRTIDWDGLVTSLAVSQSLKLPLECAFLRSDFLYGPTLQRMFGDPDVKRLIRSKFDQLETMQMEISEQRLRAHQLGRQDNPLPFPHTTSEIYGRQLYVAAPSGIARANATGRTKHPISTRVERLWDAPSLDIAASWGSLAIATGDSGLFELDLFRNGYGRERGEPPLVTGTPCTSCDWAFQSIFASSQSAGFLASFRRPTRQGRWTAQFEAQDGDRRLDRIIPSSELWHQEGYSWGVQDKLCLATNDGIHVLKYLPWLREENDRIVSVGTVRTQPWKGRVLSASTAPFGVVIELEHAIVIYPSVGAPVTLPGEPVNWRVFPRATYYQNQLHVTHEDHLEVLSFNHDYLVDQDTKQLGLSVFAATASQQRSALVS